MRSFPLLKYYLTLIFPYGDGPHAQGPHTERIDIAAKFCFKERQCRSMNCFLEREVPPSHFADPSSPGHALSFPNNAAAATGELGERSSLTNLSYQLLPSPRKKGDHSSIKSESWFVPPSNYTTAKFCERRVTKHGQAQRTRGRTALSLLQAPKFGLHPSRIWIRLWWWEDRTIPFHSGQYFKLGTT